MCNLTLLYGAEPRWYLRESHCPFASDSVQYAWLGLMCNALQCLGYLKVDGCWQTGDIRSSCASILSSRYSWQWDSVRVPGNSAGILLLSKPEKWNILNFGFVWSIRGYLRLKWFRAGCSLVPSVPESSLLRFFILSSSRYFAFFSSS